MRATTFRPKLLAGLIATMAASGALGQNLPVLSSVVSGSATASVVGNTLNVTNSANAILEWTKFSIAGGFATHFAQPNAASAVLNRVVGADPSNIFGSLTSNGRVFLINPNGIVFGQGSQINVGALVASTVPLSNANFLGGNITFDAVPSVGNIDISGGIVAVDSVLLQAKNFSASGVISVTSPSGTITIRAVAGGAVSVGSSTLLAGGSIILDGPGNILAPGAVVGVNGPGAVIIDPSATGAGGSLNLSSGASSVNLGGVSGSIGTVGGGITVTNGTGTANTTGNGLITLSGVGGLSNPGCGGVAVSIGAVCAPSANQKLILSAGPNVTGIANTVQGQIAAGIRSVVSLSSTTTPGIQYLVPTLPGGSLGSVINAQGHIGLLANRTSFGGTAIATSAERGLDGIVRLTAKP